MAADIRSVFQRGVEQAERSSTRQSSMHAGASQKAMILSVPEGDDKPLKYPLMFSISDVLVINKIDALSIFDFDIDAVEKRIRPLNPEIKVFPLSCKTGEGVDAWIKWTQQEIDKVRNQV